MALPVLALHWLDEKSADAACTASGAAKPPLVPVKPSTPRLGLAVSRKVDKRAVGRNRIKRVMREMFREYRAVLQMADYVVVARPGAAALDHEQLRNTLLSLLRRAGALPLPAATVTMPTPARADGATPASC